MTRRPVARLVLTAAVAVTALAGCGADDSKDDGGSAAQATTPTTTSTPATAPATTTPASDGAAKLTAAGSTLKIGEAATIAYEDASKRLTSTITVAPTKIEKGTIDDFKNIDLDAEEKTATPYYVEVSVRNVGSGDLTGTDPAGYIDAVDDRGQRQNEVIFFGDFERCDNSDPKSLKPGESYDTCLTYLLAKGGSVSGMRWVYYDEKTLKSDINWK